MRIKILQETTKIIIKKLRYKILKIQDYLISKKEKQKNNVTYRNNKIVDMNIAIQIIALNTNGLNISTKKLI